MFYDTLQRWLEGIAANKDRWSLRKIIEPLFDRSSSLLLSASTPAITTGGATTASTGSSDCYYIANGVLNKIAGSTVLPVLTGINIAAGNYNVVCFFGDSAGNLTAAGGTQGATLGAVVFPQFPKQKALVGFLLITYASAFTGGTTPLDTATTVYFGAAMENFDPATLIG